jgi:exopolyphosphatase/pppGpp-phosphohydrolase
LKNLEDYRENIINVTKKYACDMDHIFFVEKTSLILYDRLFDIHNLSKLARTYLSHAALLHDIGHFISKRKHHKHTKYIIENDPLLDFYSSRDRKIISFIASNHRKSIHKKTYLLPISEHYTILKSSSLLRIADALAYNGDISIENIEISNNKILLTIKSITDFDYALKRLEKKKDVFIKLFSKELFIKEK